MIDKIPDDGDRVTLHVVFYGRKVAKAAAVINHILQAAKDEMEWRDDINQAWKASKYLLKHMDIIHDIEGDDEDEGGDIDEYPDDDDENEG